MNRPPFWSDDFDMDLLQLFPGLEETLGDTAATPIWTVGHTTHGRLNHPATWNSGFVAFWLQEPDLPRDEHGWFNIDGHVSNDPVVEATWLEVLRDAWVHQYPIQIYGTGMLLWNPLNRRPEFERIMWIIREWGDCKGMNMSSDLTAVETDIIVATRRLHSVIQTEAR